MNATNATIPQLAVMTNEDPARTRKTKMGKGRATTTTPKIKTSNRKRVAIKAAKLTKPRTQTADRTKRAKTANQTDTIAKPALTTTARMQTSPLKLMLMENARMLRMNKRTARPGDKTIVRNPDNQLLMTRSPLKT